MSPDALTSLLEALADPNSLLPGWFPGGGWGAFLLFLLPIGGGIPAGVLVARDSGLTAGLTLLLYLASDVALAFLAEPLLVAARWVGARVGVVGRWGNQLTQYADQVGLREPGPRGPLGILLVSFVVSPEAGRAAAATAGHGFRVGWTLAILGDLGYFALLMVSTLWLSDQLGDSRLAVGMVLGGAWLLPVLLRGWQSRRLPRAASSPTAVAAE